MAPFVYHLFRYLARSAEALNFVISKIFMVNLKLKKGVKIRRERRGTQGYALGPKPKVWVRN